MRYRNHLGSKNFKENDYNIYIFSLDLTLHKFIILSESTYTIKKVTCYLCSGIFLELYSHALSKNINKNIPQTFAYCKKQYRFNNLNMPFYQLYDKF